MKEEEWDSRTQVHFNIIMTVIVLAWVIPLCTFAYLKSDGYRDRYRVNAYKSSGVTYRKPEPIGGGYVRVYYLGRSRVVNSKSVSRIEPNGYRYGILVLVGARSYADCIEFEGTETDFINAANKSLTYK